MLTKKDLELKVTGDYWKYLKVYLKNKEDALHEGPWLGAQTRYLAKEKENFIGFLDWYVKDNVITIDALEIRQEYRNTVVLTNMLLTFKQQVIKPLIKEYGKGNVYIKTGFQNQDLWDMVERVMPILGLKWHESVDEEYINNIVGFKFLSELEKHGTRLGGQMVANFSTHKYRELYNETFGYDIPNGYWMSNIDTNGDIIYSSSDNDFNFNDEIGNTGLYRNDEIIVDLDENLIAIYKKHPELVNNFELVVGPNGKVEFDSQNIFLAKEKELIKEYINKEIMVTQG